MKKEHLILPTETILVLGGSLTESAASLIKAFLPLRLLAVDQAYHRLNTYGLKPNYIIGDFDSVDLEKVDSEVVKLERYDQYMSDFEKALEFIREQKWGRASIFGFTGGEFDHILGNVSVLAKSFIREDEFYILDYNGSKCKIGLFVGKNTKFHSYVGAKVSLFPFPKAVISSRGLKYKLSTHAISQDQGILAIRNELIEPEVTLEVLEGKVFVIFDAEPNSLPRL